ncbi:hypothetical protein KEM60_00473 [Austwickia sp. TVS 96-490-7B]|nr:hypothetical protein [Austwickia sp. TVS 96-490-7B]
MGSTFPGPDALWGFYSPVTRAWEFAAGAVVALVPAPQWWGRGVRSTVWGLAGMTSLVATSLLVTGESPWPGPLTLVPVLATVAVILAGDSRSAHPNVVTQMLSRPRWVAVGDWSYSLYLWHWPCIVTAVMIWPRHVWVATVAAGLSVVPAVLSYRWVEEPLRRRSLSWDRHLVRVVAAVTIPPVLAAGGLFVASSHRWWSSRVDRYAEAIGATHVGFRYGCDQRIPLGEVAARCTWGADRPGTPIYLLGDSNADHITEAVVGAGEELGRPVTVANTNACPFLDVTFHDHRQGWRNQNDSCRDYVQKTVQHMMNTRPDTVVIANSDVYWHEQQIALGSPGEGSSTDLRVKMTALRSGLESTVKKLRSAGHQVLVVQGTPKWWDSHSWDPHRCSTISVMAASCRAAMTVTEAETGQGEVRAVVQDVVADAAASSQVTASSVSSGKSRDPLTGAHVIPTVAVWDTWAELCPEGICTTHDGDMVRYRDGNHLTVAQSKVLAAPLARQLQELG